MFKELIELFKKPAAKEFAQEELEESHRQFLKHEMSAQYHAKIAEYYQGNILRLGSYIKKA